MSDGYNVIRLFLGYIKNPPKILYKKSDIIINEVPYIDKKSNKMIVSWAFMESPWIKHESSINL